MIEADYYDEVSSSSFSRWVIPALVISIALHVWLLYWACGVSLAANSQKVCTIASSPAPSMWNP